MRVAIIGAGITGLSLGYALEKKGIQSCIFETANSIGGVMKSFKEHGYLYEYGPHSLEIKTPTVRDFINELEVANDIVTVSSKSNRYILKDERLLPLPLSPKAFIKTPLFSAKAKFRLLAEPFIKKGQGLNDESLADFVKRRLGVEFLDYAIDPFVSGVFAGDPNNLSVKSAFPKLYELESNYGSLIKGAFKSKRKKKLAFKKKIISFKEGMQTLPLKIAQKLSGKILLSTNITSIDQKGDYWELTWGGKQVIFDALIVTVPAYKLLDLPWSQEVLNALALFKDIHYAPVATINLGFRKQDISGSIDGFGFLAPRKENIDVLGTLYSSSMFPCRAPDGEVLLTTFVGGIRYPEKVSLGEDALKQMTLESLQPLLQIKCKELFSKVIYYPKAIPQYTVNYSQHIDAIDALESHLKNLKFAGNYRTGISVGQCIESSIELAKQY